MIYVVQLFLFCGLFTALVAVGTGGRAINEIYFYPKPYLSGHRLYWRKNYPGRAFFHGTRDRGQRIKRKIAGKAKKIG